MSLKLAPKSKLLFIGDSITDCGRTNPVGEGLFDAHGKGYVNLVVGHLGAVFPEAQIRVVNMGTSGNTVRELKARWQRDVIDLRPDWLAIMIGINDVWRQFDLPLNPECHVGLEEYEQTLGELVCSALPNVKGLVLMTPFFIEPNPTDAMRARMDAYGAAVKRVAAQFGTGFVDTQAAFNAVLAHTPSAALAWDRVHPNVVGHTVLARSFLAEIGAI
jgi:lysophospholipase L1-like esterase